MIRKHIDIIAVLMLLAGFAIASQTRTAAVRLVRARLEICRRPAPIQVHVAPFKMYHFNQRQQGESVPGGARLI
jgi:hypothetical protein